MTPAPSSHSRSQAPVVLAITGASGAPYGKRMLQLLVAQAIPTHLVVSSAGRRLLRDELNCDGSPQSLLDCAKDDPRIALITEHPERDIGAAIASGSFLHQGMVIAPCSSGTLGAIAHGLSTNLVQRAAQVCLKERRKLILLHRETPLSLIDIRAMETITLAGGIIMPASPGFYTQPKHIADMVDFLCARTLDLLGLHAHGLPIRWDGTHSQ